MSLNRQHVVDGALRLVDEKGLDALTLRALATRLNVQAPTLYWHVRNKAELIDALADAIVDDAMDAIREQSPRESSGEWLLAALTELRRAVLAHPDGARIISSARGSMRRADFSELAMATLVEQGVELQKARLTVLVGERFTIGYVLEEQAPEPAQPTPDLAEIQHRLPTATRAIIEYFATGRTADDLYRDSVRLILGLSAGS